MGGGSVLEMAMAALLMRVGITLYAGGLSRSKNAASACIRSVIDLAVAGISFWAIGAGIQFGISWFLGGEFAHPINQHHEESEILRALCGVLMATGLATAAIGERSTGEFMAAVSATLAALI